MTASFKHLAKLDTARETTGRNYGRIYAYDKYLRILNEGTEPLNREFQVEEAIASSHKISLSSKRLHLDLQKATLISPLGVTTLLCWSYEVSANR